jgi:predicted RNase H-like HicB family nuclease
LRSTITTKDWPGRTDSRTDALILEWDNEGQAYHVTVPALPGCVTHGSTREEALSRIQEAIKGHIQGLKLIGEPIPESDVDIAEVQVNVFD